MRRVIGGVVLLLLIFAPGCTTSVQPTVTPEATLRLRGQPMPFVSRGGLKLRELKAGDYVVHQDYGVSRYRGLTPVSAPGAGTADCLQLEFRGSDTLYIPMTEFNRVQRYSDYKKFNVESISEIKAPPQ